MLKDHVRSCGCTYGGFCRIANLVSPLSDNQRGTAASVRVPMRVLRLVSSKTSDVHALIVEVEIFLGEDVFVEEEIVLGNDNFVETKVFLGDEVLVK